MKTIIGMLLGLFLTAPALASEERTIDEIIALYDRGAVDELTVDELVTLHEELTNMRKTLEEELVDFDKKYPNLEEDIAAFEKEQATQKQQATLDKWDIKCWEVRETIGNRFYELSREGASEVVIRHYLSSEDPETMALYKTVVDYLYERDAGSDREMTRESANFGCWKHAGELEDAQQAAAES